MISNPIGVDVSKTFDEIYHIRTLEKSRIKQIKQMIPLKKEFKENYNININ